MITLEPGGSLDFNTASDETILLPLGGAATASAEESTYDLAGRTSVFDCVTDIAYLPIETAVTVASAAGGELALVGARTIVRLPSAMARHRASRWSCAAPAPAAVR